MKKNSKMSTLDLSKNNRSSFKQTCQDNRMLKKHRTIMYPAVSKPKNLVRNPLNREKKHQQDSRPMKH